MSTASATDQGTGTATAPGNPVGSLDVFDPSDPETWIARGRHPDDASVIARAWREFPDLPIDAAVDRRCARTRARTEQLRPLYEAMSKRTDDARQAQNFAFTETSLAAARGDEREIAILRGRDEYGYDWDNAVQYAYGWYAAHAGSSYNGASADRDGAVRADRAGAYHRGFVDGGGNPDDVFDTARRANLAAARKGNQTTPANVVPNSRPLPSKWPRPTDAPRCTPWSRRLLVIAGRDTTGSADAMPALARYDGAFFNLVRAQPGHEAATIVILSAAHGFVGAGEMLFPCETSMTPERATSLASDQRQHEKLTLLVRASDPEDVLVVASGEQLP